MGIEFNTTFGDRSKNNKGRSGNMGDQPKATYWLNIGYLADAIGDEKAKFVSLPVGIPLDTMEKLSTRSSNKDFAMFQAARNDLLDQLVEAASGLEPGDDYVMPLEGSSGLAIQVRRVNAEAAEPVVDESNHYARPKLFAVG